MKKLTFPVLFIAVSYGAFAADAVAAPSDDVLLSAVPPQYRTLAAALIAILTIWVPRIIKGYQSGGLKGAVSGAVVGTNTPKPTTE